MACKTNFTVNRDQFQIEQETKYPWEGTVLFKVTAENSPVFCLKIRVPGWAQNHPVPGNLYSYLEKSGQEVRLLINKELFPVSVVDGYVSVDRRWNDGDVVELVLPMAVRKVVPNENIREIAGKLAIERGPVVYCAEQADNPQGVLHKKIAKGKIFTPKFEANFLQGIVKLESDDLMLVPYYAWSHRGLGEMTVWFNQN